MKFSQEVPAQLRLLILSFWLVYTLPLSSAQNLTASLDRSLNVTVELRGEIEQVWCNGMNYTALCQGWPQTYVCFGEVIRAEFLMIKNDSSLYDYDKERLGRFLDALECDAKETPLVLKKKKAGVRVGQWIFIIVMLIGCAFLTRLLWRMNKLGKFGGGFASSAGETSVNDVTSASTSI